MTGTVIPGGLFGKPALDICLLVPALNVLRVGIAIGFNLGFKRNKVRIPIGSRFASAL